MGDSVDEEFPLKFLEGPIGKDGTIKGHQLTSLQIRDIASYVHNRLWVIVDHKQKRLVFLVDYGPPNRKWSKSSEVWQRFVSQSRRSPFVNHQELKKVRHRRSFPEHLGGSQSQGCSPLSSRTNRFFDPLRTATTGLLLPIKRGPFFWLGGVVPAVRERWRVHGLYGCLAFEMRLADVVGVNYLNELQSDGCVALEASEVRKREFGDFTEAWRWYGGAENRGLERGLGSGFGPDQVFEVQQGLSGENRPQRGVLYEKQLLSAEPSKLSKQTSGGLRRRARASAVTAGVGEIESFGTREKGLTKSTLYFSHQPTEPPIGPQLSSELFQESGGLSRKPSFQIADADADLALSNEPGRPSKSNALFQPSESDITSPLFQSAQSSPALGGPCFSIGSVGCCEERALVCGGKSFGEGLSCPTEGRLDRAELQTCCVASNLLSEITPAADKSFSATEWSSNKAQRYNPVSDRAPSQAVAGGSWNAGLVMAEEPANRCITNGLAQKMTSTQYGSGRTLRAETSTGVQECRGSLQTSNGSKRRFHRQRSRSLDDPELKAVLHRVAEQAAQIAAYKESGPNSGPDSQLPSSQLSVSSAKRRRLWGFLRAPSSGGERSATAKGSRRRLALTVRSLPNSLHSPSEPKSPSENPSKPPPVAEIYTDRLVVFRFKDPLLPEELKEAITTDQQLLKMLESGLPTWAVFVQSYPALCHVYRPWMRRISGYLYFLVSAVTVLIGFYDLYKNLPFVQDFLHRLFGPLYDWVEQWQMGARLGYLGTMLFLQNFQKAFRAAQGVVRSLKYLGSVAFRPIAYPLWMGAELFRPIGAAVWGLVWEAAALFGGVGSGILAGVWYAVVYLVSPVVGFGRTVGLAGVQLLYPIWTAVSSVLLLPLTLFASLFSGIAPLFPAVGETFQVTYASVAGTARIVTRVPARQAVSAAKAASNEGMFRGLWMSLYTVWNDLFWKVFGAVRRIVFGFLAFILEINKHRLSTYNYVEDCLVQFEDAMWQCLVCTEEIIWKLCARVSSSLSFSLRGGRAGHQSEGGLSFVDARDCFEEELW